MKRKKFTDDEILTEIYRRVYAVSEPPADFDQLMATPETNAFGQKVIKFMDHECDDEVMKKICNDTLDEFKVKGYKRNQFFYSFWLGCSPRSKKQLNEQLKD
jgi:hypothetical protein